MERKIGEVFAYNGVILEVIEIFDKASCKGCYFSTNDRGCNNYSEFGCSWGKLNSGFTFVIFKEV